MKRSLVGFRKTATDVGVAPQLAAGCELAPEELAAVHGGELKLEVPAYIPLSVSHPKTEVVLPRVPYK
jgi:hypothetical protein